MLTLTQETVGDVLVVALSMNNLDATTGETFRGEVEPLLEEEAQVVFDLGQVEFVDSAGLAVLLSCLKHLVAVGGDLKLCMLGPKVQDLFERARMPQIVEIHPTREDALRSYA